MFNDNVEKCNICPINLLQKAIGGKWKISILWQLKERKRFNQLQKQFPAITQTMLTKQLRELEKSGFIHREVYKEVPPKVEYSLTTMGADFMPIIDSMNEWSTDHVNQLIRSDKEKN